MQKLNLMCPINFTGYGISSYNIYRELRKQLDTTLFPIGNVSVENEEAKTAVVEDINKQHYYDNKTPFFKIWHQFDLASRIGKGKYGALTFFEIDKLKPIEVCMINNLDVIFVASQWAKKILIDNGVSIDIQVSPLGVDMNIFDPDKFNNVKTDDKYIFINIGKWEIRKGHDVLVDMFNEAFSEKDNVELWMMNENPFLTKEQHMTWANLYTNSKLGNKIRILPRVPNHTNVAQIISIADCGFFPARAEGWNNEAIECMALNKPIILTDYAAHTEYANKDNAFLIETKNLVPAIDDHFFNGYGNWADLGADQFDQAVEYMRYVYKNNVRSNPKGLETAKKFSWNNTANIITKYMV